MRGYLWRAASIAMSLFFVLTPTVHVRGESLGADQTIQVDAALVADLPSGSLFGYKIGIDPGHQLHANNEKEPVSPGSREKKPKVSSGTSGVRTRVAEHVVNLEVSLLLRDALEKQGAQVLMTRETADVDVSNIERAQMMNDWGADLVLRLHCNGASSKSARGIGVYVRKTGDKAAESADAAQCLLDCMVEATGGKRSGLFKRDTYSGLNWSTVPSVLVEMGFMSNPDEDELLNTPSYQQQLVDGMVAGIEAYLGLDGGGQTDADALPTDDDADEAPTAALPETVVGE